MNDCIRKMPFFQTLVREIDSLRKSGYRYIHILTDDREVADRAEELYREICLPHSGSDTGNASGETSEKYSTRSGQGRSLLGSFTAENTTQKKDNGSKPGISVEHITDAINALSDKKGWENAGFEENSREEAEGTLRKIYYGHADSNKPIPVGLENLIATLELPPMVREDITAIIRKEAAVYREEVFGDEADGGEFCFEIDDQTARWYCNRMKRMEYSEICRIIRGFLRCGRCRENFECLYETSLQEKFGRKTHCAERYFIVPAKNEKLKRHNKLECIRITVDDDYTLCGAGAINKWFADHKAALTNWDDPFAPKGMFLVGVPGTGKSLTAKFAAQELQLPLVKLDIGKILGRYVGESEHAMQEAMEDLAFNAPCILWIDEIEKSFGHNQQDSTGVMSRLFGQLLNFMQEKKEKVFVIATANSTQGLPPELMRLGRFDIHFKMMMPTWAECIELLKNSFQKAEKELKAAYGSQKDTGFVHSAQAEDIDQVYGIINSAVTDPEAVLGVITGCKAGGCEKGKCRFVTGADIDTIVREIVQLAKNEIAREREDARLARNEIAREKENARFARNEPARERENELLNKNETVGGTESARLHRNADRRKSKILELTEKVTRYISVTAEEENPTSMERLGESYLNLLPQAFVLANSEPDPRTGKGTTENPFRDVSLDKSRILDYCERSDGSGENETEVPSCLPLEPSCGTPYDRQLYRCIVREMNRILVRDPDCLEKGLVMKRLREIERKNTEQGG